MESTNSNIQLAIFAVKTGVSLRQAAMKYDLNRQTLKNHLDGKHGKTHGGQQKFSAVEENHFADLLLRCADLGVPPSTIQLPKVVLRYCLDKGLSAEKQSFTGKWHRSFLRRHPAIAIRICRPQNRKKAADCTPTLCEEWIKKLDHLAKEGYLTDPSGLWNLDESGFSLAEVWQRVHAARGEKCVAGFYDGAPKKQITVLAGGNAAGFMLRPFILYDGKVQLSSRFEGTNDKCLIDVNQSGWMDNPNFTSFVKAELIPAMTAEKNVIFVDGRSSHINNLELLLACRDSHKNIKVVCLPSGQTSRLQPFDRSVFGGVKYNWRMHLRALQSGCFDGLPPISRNSFPQHLIRLFEKCHLSATLQSGFKLTGIFPFDANIIRSTIVQNAVSHLGRPDTSLDSPKRRVKQAPEAVRHPQQTLRSF